jgi:penicillin G amidase
MKRAFGGVLVAALLSFGCGDDERTDEQDLTRPPVGSPFSKQRPPDVSAAHPALSRQVEIVTDEFGIPHIYAENRKDLLFANGYVHARDRLFLMDALRMLGQGRVSEYIGEVGMGFDPLFRATFMTAEGKQVSEAIVEQLPVEIVELLQAYANGVNAYLGELRAGTHPLPPDYQTGLLEGLTANDIGDWQPRDTISVARMLEWQLTDGGGAFDQAMAELIQKLPPDVFADVVRFQPSDPTVILPGWFSELKSAPAPARAAPASDLLGLDPRRPSERAAYLAAQQNLQGFDFARLRKVHSPFGDPGVDPVGSNNWVISGQHTQSGHPIIADDPHLALMQPAQFHHAHLDTRLYGKDPATQASSIGISLAGVSGVPVGHNEHVAWGVTVVGWDVTDIYIETLNPAGDAVLFDGNWVPIQRFEQTFKIGRGADAPTQTVMIEYVPHHGPILEGSKVDGKALTAKWTGRLVDNGVVGIVELLSVRNIDDWMGALEKIAVFSQNWNGADIDGNIGYFPHAWIPIRKRVDGDCAPYKPVDGTGACEWVGFLPASEVPQSKNRANGWLVTANNDVAGTLQDNDPTNDPQYLLSERDIGFRGGRITQLIEEMIASGKKITLDDMEALQADTKSLEAERFRPLLLAAAQALPDKVTELGLAPALARLESWKLTTPSGVAADYRTDGGPSAEEIDESIASSIFYAWAPRLKNRLLDDELAEYGVTLNNDAKTRAVLFLLEHPDQAATGSSLIDDITTAGVVETKDELMLEALADGLAYLASAEAFGSSDMTTWRWGNLHQMEMRDLFSAFAPVAFITRGPYPRGGAPFTVDVANHGGNPKSFVYRSGPQMRFVAELLPDGIVSRNALPGGQSDDPESPHYEDLLKLWLRNESFPYYFRTEDVAAHIETYELFHP